MATNMLEPKKKKVQNELYNLPKVNNETILKETSLNIDEDNLKLKEPEKTNKENIVTEQVSTQTITIIQPQNNQIKPIDERIFNEREKTYLNKVSETRYQIDNPIITNKLSKRERQYEKDRRNVTFSIRKDIAILIDDLVDDARMFKGLFIDELLLLGITAYIEKHGIE